MHEFKYRGNQFYCEGVRIDDLARKFGTPLYIYSYHTLVSHFLKLQQAFRSINPLICYSVKANSNLAILRALVDKGAGLDIVSGGELCRAQEAGCPAEKIVYASVGKTVKEIEDALRRRILFFNVESIPELEKINSVARRLRLCPQVAIRINPDVEPKTHKYITTGKLSNKFGIDLKSAYGILRMRRRFANLKISGLHIHIGSQITESSPYIAAIKKVAGFIEKLGREGIGLEYFNIGGGLGIIYDNENAQSADSFAKKVLPLLNRTGLKIIMEPGRFIVGNAGILLTQVLYIKKTPLKKFIIVDAGMNDLIRPSLYGAYHKILVSKISGINQPNERADVVGPICESGDFFAKERLLPRVKEGDHLCMMSAGAYGFSMSSNYNSRLRAAEIMVVKDRYFLIRKRENRADLYRNEKIPSFLLGL